MKTPFNRRQDMTCLSEEQQHELYNDLMIYGNAFTQIIIEDGLPVVSRIDPRKVLGYETTCIITDGLEDD